MMRRLRHERRRRAADPNPETDEESDEEEVDEEDEVLLRMNCLSCKEEYCGREAGTCRDCYDEAGEAEEELKREIDELKAKVNFLRLLCVGPSGVSKPDTSCFSDVVLVASNPPDSRKPHCASSAIPAHRALLASRSPVFRAMLENEMEESLSGTIKISDVSYEALRAFVNYLYSAEASLDEQLACDLLVLAEKYQVKHLKNYCERYLMSKLNWENSLPIYAFAHQHGASNLQEAALSLIMENMDKLSKREEYIELVEKDPRVVVQIYEAYLSRQVNTAASTGSKCKS